MKLKTICQSVMFSCLFGATALASADTVLINDDFSTSSLNGTKWGQGSWPLGRTGFGNPVQFSSESGVNFMRLNLDTYNPNQPGQSLYGADVYSNQRFPVGSGLELEARVRATTVTSGQVASAFLFEYDMVNGGQDELDMEILTNKPTNTFLATGFNDWQAAFGYANPQYFSAATITKSAYNYSNWNTYKIRWFTDRVEWYLNGEMVRSITTPVPTTDLQVHMNFWAPASDWTDAYSSTLKPVSKKTSNTRYSYDVDYVKVTQLDVAPPPVVNNPLQVSSSVSTDWGTGYCKDVTVTNPNAAEVDWSVDLPFSDIMTNSWDAVVVQINPTTIRAEGSGSSNMLGGFASKTFGYCANRPITTLSGNDLAVVRTVTEDWGSGHCENVNVKNVTNNTGKWSVDLSVAGTMTTNWSSIAQQNGGSINFKGLEWNETLSPSESTNVGFCVQQ